MDNLKPEVDSEPPELTSTININNSHMVSTESMDNLSIQGLNENQDKGTVVFNPNHCVTVGKMLKEMQDASDLCDISVRFNGIPIPAHKCILAANSPVLYKFIKNSANDEIDIPGDTSINDVTLTSFVYLVDFMYKGELCLNIINLESILKLSFYLKVPGVALLCSRYMQDTISSENWVYFQNLTSQYSLGDESEQRISEFIYEHLPLLMHDDGIFALSHNEIRHIIKTKNSKCDSDIELCKLELILRWSSFNSLRSAFFSDLISYIDMGLMQSTPVKKLGCEYSSVVSMLPNSSWETFLKNVCDDPDLECACGNNGNIATLAEPIEESKLIGDRRTSQTLGNANSQLLQIEKTEDQNEPKDSHQSITRLRQSQDKKALDTITRRNSGESIKKTFQRKRCNKRKGKNMLKLKTKRLCKSKIPPIKTIISTKRIKVAQEICDSWEELDTEVADPEEDVPLHTKPIFKESVKVEDQYGDVTEINRIKRVRAKKATTEAEMYQCEKCPRKFATPSALRHHMKGHGATQPFLCEICGFSTIHFASMNVHKRQHNDQLRFHCSWPGCSYMAIRRSRLDDHMAAHKGIKNFVCSTCGKAFSGRKHLHRHEHIHRGDKLKCTECDYESPRKDKLRDHLKKHHPDVALEQGIVTADQMLTIKPITKPRKTGSKKLKRTERLPLAEQDLRHEEEDHKAASVLQSDTMLTSTQVPFSNTVQPNYIHLMPSAHNIPDDLLHYVIAIAPQQSQQTSGQPNSVPYSQQTLSQPVVVSDNTVTASEPTNLISANRTIQPQPSIGDSQMTMFF